MNNPFPFDRPVQGKAFFGRKWLLETLTNRALHGKNSFVLAPVGWGKTSLALEVAGRTCHENYKFRACWIGIRPGMSVEEFFRETVYQLSSLYGLRNSSADIKVSRREDSLIFPELIATSHNVRILLIVTGLKYIIDYHSPSGLLSTLIHFNNSRSNCSWLFLDNHYLLSQSSQAQFAPEIRKAGSVFFLSPLAVNPLAESLSRQFSASGMRISGTAISAISSESSRIPFFMQLLSWHCWNTGTKACTVRTVARSIKELTGHYCHSFRTMLDCFPQMQIRLLRSLAENEQPLYSRENVSRHHLKSTGHVARAYKSLIDKGIVVDYDHTPVLCNPFFRHWIRAMHL